VLQAVARHHVSDPNLGCRVATASVAGELQGAPGSTSPGAATKVKYEDRTDGGGSGEPVAIIAVTLEKR